jgi:hypothetical protein
MTLAFHFPSTIDWYTTSAHPDRFMKAHENVPKHDTAALTPSPMKIGVGSVNTNPAITYDHSAEYAAKPTEANAEISRFASRVGQE